MPISDHVMRAIDEYSARGWNVIPTISRKTGVLPVCEWHRWVHEKQKYVDVIDLFESHEHDGIAIVTGAVSGIAVIDVDLKKGANTTEWATKYFGSPIVQTPSGGLHIYFEYREGITNRAEIQQGIDVRGEGGIVFAPPTTRYDGKYEWANNNGALVPFPELEDLRETEFAGDRVKEVDTFMSAKVSKGARNSHLARCAGYLVSQGMPKDIILTLVQGINKLNVSPPLPDSEVIHCVNSIINTAERRSKIIRTNSVVPFEMNAGNENFSLMGYEDFMVKFGETNVEWICPKWMPDATMLFMVSPPECFKTWLELDLAVSIASGKPFLNRYEINPEKVGPVVIIQQEDFAGQTAQRLALIHRSKFKSEIEIAYTEDGTAFDVQIPMLQHLPIVVHTESKLNMNDKSVVDGMLQALRKLRPRAVFIDPLYSVVSSNNYMAEAPSQLMVFKRLRDEIGCSFVFAHHAGKEKREGGKAVHDDDRQRIWGSQLLNGFIESGWQISKVKAGGSSIYIDRHFKSAKAEGRVALTFDINTEGNNFYYEVATGNVEATMESENSLQLDAFEDEDKSRAKNVRKTINPETGPNKEIPIEEIRTKPDGFFEVPQYGVEVFTIVDQYREYIHKFGTNEDSLPFDVPGMVFKTMMSPDTKIKVNELAKFWNNIPISKIVSVAEKIMKLGIFKLTRARDEISITDQFKELLNG